MSVSGWRAQGMTDGEFLEYLQEALENVPASGRFGLDKVFISEAHREFPIEMSLDDFKQRLAKLQRQGKVNLSRADLPDVMDGAKVNRSVIRDAYSTYHFIRTES